MRKVPIYLVRFSSQYEITSTFMRFQEYYESPRFRGRVFSWEDFMDWYAKQKGNFTYFEDWNGFNIPSHVLAPFYAGKFNPLMKKEEKLLSRFKNMGGNFYIIGTWRTGKEGDLNHEITHGLFYCRPDYQRQVRRCMRHFDTSVIKRELLKLGYHSAVIVDEINAYVLNDIGGLKDTKLSGVRHLRIALRKIFRSYFGYDIWEKEDRFLLQQIHQVTF